ncbi:MAG: protein kinase [Polyangiales bacterium]
MSDRETSMGASPPETTREVSCSGCGVTFNGSLGECPVCGMEQEKSRAGTLLAGKYNVGGLLGKGGMGVVHKGTRVSDGGLVAIKFLLGQWAARGEIRARFQREADVLRQLKHPGIVTAEAFGEDEGDLYLVMEFVAGKLLSDQIENSGVTMSVERMVKVTDRVLEVLEVAHAQGIVHRDLKPENIMTLPTLEGADDADVHIKIFDFGLALVPDHEVAKRLTETYAVHGTPFYMSPEQCRGRDVGPPTDIYAVGAMMFEMLAGAPPFDADNMATLLVQQMFVEPPRIAEKGVKREAPPALEAIVRRALGKNAPDRPNASELRRMLRDAMSGEDDVSRAQRATAEKIASAMATRDERALSNAHDTVMERPKPVLDGALAPTEPGADLQARVALAGFSDARVGALRAVFGAHGIGADVVSDAASIASASSRCAVLVLAGGADVVERTTKAKAEPSFLKFPILVIDHSVADDLPRLIRAGASDAVIGAVADDVLVQKVRRLVKRKR